MQHLRRMTHLGAFLTTTLQEETIDARELAERMDIDPAVLSRLINGKRRSCTASTLRKIVLGASRRPIKRAHCLAAYMRDQCFEPYDRRITVAVR